MNKKIFFYYVFYFIIFILSSIYSFIHQMSELYYIPIGLIACFILPLFFKILKLNMILEFHILNVFFVTFTIVFGSILNFYSWYYYDKILHFTSGILFSGFSYILYDYLVSKNNNKDIKVLCLLFMNAMNMMVAVLWEFYEYACLIFLNNDAIHHYSSGVHDSMGDMIVALCGGIVVTIGIIWHYKTNKKNVLVRMSGKFTQMNL